MVHWRIWTNARTESKARRAFSRALEGWAAEPRSPALTPYPKTGGFVLSFETEVTAASWAEGVLEAIVLGQQLAVGWVHTGDLRYELSLWSNEPTRPSIQHLSLEMDRGAIEDYPPSSAFTAAVSK